MYFDIFTHGIQPTETEFPTANSIIIQQLELFAEANLLFITLFSDEIQESKMKINKSECRFMILISA